MSRNYVEKFPLRKREFSLEKGGVVIIETGFFKTSERFVSFDSMGRFVHYNYELKVFNIITVLGFIVFGSYAIYRSNHDSILFAIGLLLIGVSVVWISQVIGNVSYVGEFYLTDISGHKDNSAIAIKSQYPANKELQEFIEKLRSAQVDHLIHKYYESIDEYYPPEDFIATLSELKSQFNIDDQDYQYWVFKAKEKWSE